MRLRRKPRVKVRLLWDANVVVAIALFVDGKLVGCIPLLSATGQMTVLGEGVTLEHGGDRAAPHRLNAAIAAQYALESCLGPSGGGRQTRDAEERHGANSPPDPSA